MRAITQGHEGQQRPLVLVGRVLALVEADPRFDFGAPRMVEVDDAHKRRQRRGRHVFCMHFRESDSAEGLAGRRGAHGRRARRANAGLGVGGDETQPCGASRLGIPGTLPSLEAPLRGTGHDCLSEWASLGMTSITCVLLCLSEKVHQFKAKPSCKCRS